MRVTVKRKFSGYSSVVYALVCLHVIKKNFFLLSIPPLSIESSVRSKSVQHLSSINAALLDSERCSIMMEFKMNIYFLA